MKKLSFWYRNARPISLPQSLLPALTALSLAWGRDSFSWGAAGLALAGVIFTHLGMNLADDWFDYRVKSGETRQKLASDGIRARVVKYPYLTSGEATSNELLLAVGVFFFLAVCCGLAMLWIRGTAVLWFALAAFLIGISYSGAPLRLGFRGWGEAVIFLMFGPLLMTGVCYAACGEISWNVILLSVAVGMLVTNIIYTHSILDAEPDRRMGKLTMAHLLGSPNAMAAGSLVINLLPYLLIAGGVLSGNLHVAYMSVWIVLPLSVWLVHSLCAFIFGRPVKIEPKAWMGPMGDFEKFRQAGIDWFMLRWLAARNIVTFFCLIIILVSIVLHQISVS